MQSTKWARGHATLRNLTVGPRHDPYSRTVVTVTIDGRTYTLMRCGLAGDSITLPDGGGEIFCAEGMPFDRESQTRALDNYEAEVVRYTGQKTDFWFHKLWQKLEEKRDPGLQAMIDADMRLLSYAV